MKLSKEQVDLALEIYLPRRKEGYRRVVSEMEKRGYIVTFDEVKNAIRDRLGDIYGRYYPSKNTVESEQYTKRKRGRPTKIKPQIEATTSTPQKDKPITLSTIRNERKDSRLESRILELTSKEVLTINELAQITKTSDNDVQSIINELIERGYSFNFTDGFIKLDKNTVSKASKILLPYNNNVYTCGIVSDTHGGSSHEQISALNTFYDICYSRGIKDMFHGGDVCAGINMYRGQEFEVHAIGADKQADWVINTYPQRPGMTTYIIAGNHDASFKSAAGYDIVRGICKDRKDMIYSGFMEGQVELENGLRIELLHPDGGVPYARSYRSQKINEARGRGDNLPHISVIGHCHITLFSPYLGIYDFMAGCFEGQTTYEKRKGLNPDIGGWILTISMKDGKPIRIEPEWIPFNEIKDDYLKYK